MGLGLSAIAALLFSPTAWGQATGSFSGTVTDKSGSPVSGATVTVTWQGTGAVRETTTDEPRHYTVNPASTDPHALFASVYLLNHWGLPGFSNHFHGRVQVTETELPVGWTDRLKSFVDLDPKNAQAHYSYAIANWRSQHRN